MTDDAFVTVATVADLPPGGLMYVEVGEDPVCLVNLDPREPVELSAGDRIAQLLVMPFVTASFTPVDALDETERGSGGYGSTGVGHRIHELPGRPNK